MTTTFTDNTQLENGNGRLHMPYTMALANVHACRQETTRLKREVGQLERFSSHPLTMLQREATCLQKVVRKLQWEPFLKPLPPVLQRENTRLAKEVDKLQDKLWRAMERADQDSQAVGNAHKKAEQAERLAAAAESRRMEVQGQLDELQPQLQVSLLSLHGALQQPSGQHRGSWTLWSYGHKFSLPSCSAVPTLAPVSVPPLRCAHGHNSVKASWGRPAAQLTSTSWHHLRDPHCAHGNVVSAPQPSTLHTPHHSCSHNAVDAASACHHCCGWCGRERHVQWPCCSADGMQPCAPGTQLRLLYTCAG